MPDWLIWVAIAAFFMSFRGRMSCRDGCDVGTRRIGQRSERMRKRLHDRGAAGSRGQARLASGGERDPSRSPRQRSARTAARATRRESPLEALQRRFVSGTLTLEQYEAELDKLERLQ